MVSFFKINVTELIIIKIKESDTMDRDRVIIKITKRYSRYVKNYFDKEIFDLNYEDLINNSENVIKKIINFCGLEWQDKCLEYYNNKRSIKTVSFSQARKPIYKNSLKGTEKFKSYIAELENALSSSKVR